jgi:hypothetical protein
MLARSFSSSGSVGNRFLRSEAAAMLRDTSPYFHETMTLTYDKYAVRDALLCMYRKDDLMYEWLFKHAQRDWWDIVTFLIHQGRYDIAYQTLYVHMYHSPFFCSKHMTAIIEHISFLLECEKMMVVPWPMKLHFNVLQQLVHRLSCILRRRQKLSE